ncbi:UvrD-helicase domain-containing protein [Olsenella uli]|uniref:HelD family protein n=1 Tax=Olsenella uli TaxID=133926 RepID=UPI001957CBDF|nr:UvrD-helicase domain-containing protein [Olsenella uli]MBM6815707.1 UvrD-helicase domain-containing protein [Olsenella uli]
MPENIDAASNVDPIFQAEQDHLTELYAQLLKIRDDISADLESNHRGAKQDLIAMSEEVRLDFGGADETIETLAAIETLNSVIDAYNQYHDFNVDKLRRVMLLLMQPYFAKVTLEMRPGRPPRDVYIGTAGMTDERSRPLVVDWRSPVAETYYNQEMGPTSYEVDGKVRTVNLTLRRQFDIVRDQLNSYFDTTVAIQDSLLLGALKKHHTEKLQAITATIQREQNQVVRHEDVPVLLVNGIAGSGKTSVLLQRIAYLLYQERKTLSPDQVWLFTPNDVFEHYIDTVLPSMGEANPQTLTWRAFVEAQGAGERDLGVDTAPESLRRLEEAVAELTLEPDDLREIRFADEVLLRAGQVQSAAEKFAQFPIGPRFTALVKDELHERLERRFTQLSKSDEVQEEMLDMDVEQQVEVFGETISPDDDDEVAAYARRLVEQRYAGAHDEIERLSWIRFDRIGMRLLGQRALSATEWLYLRLLFTGTGDKSARFVMVDEVQDYTEAQLMVLARHFSRAHFLLLGDEHQAIMEGTATFPRIAEIFRASHGSVDECRLLTSYRSSPEITELFCGLLEPDERRRLTSVQRAGIKPDVRSFAEKDAYLAALREAVAEPGEGLTAVIAESDARVSWLAKQLGDAACVLGKNSDLPASGVVLLSLRVAKGLEFDHVIVPDAQAEVYPDTPLARRRLYTALSRAMHRVTVLAQGPLTPMLG